MLARALLTAGVILAALFGASGGSADVPPPSVVAATATYPPGPDGVILKRARALLDSTPALLPKNVGGSLSCTSCHIAGGTQSVFLHRYLREVSAVQRACETLHHAARPH
jgi:hypothetical protein